VFQGLIDKATSPDEVAGVLAHEIGHVAGRDGTRSILQTAGLSFMFGMLLGDFVGGGAVVLAARTLLQTSYSRDVEAAADAYAVMLMTRLGADPRALATMLERIAGENEGGIKILLSHPVTRDRVAAIATARAPAMRTPILDAADWADLKRICRSR
jgi:predicted Zn-dependent protease